MKKILHITNWYPNRWHNIEALFIKEQFEEFSKVTKGKLLHVQAREGKRLFQYQYIKYSDSEEGYYLFTKIKSNKIIELLTTFLLLYVLYKSKYKQYDLLHFHIAYPLLSYHHIWKRVIKKPIILSEHWSAYHFNFYMPKATKKLDGIKRIFKQNIPLLVVSKALLNDIQNFSDREQMRYKIIPNVINTNIFFYKNEKSDKTNTFFMVNNWRKIKNPFPILEGFSLLHQEQIDFNLIIGGYGELVEEMQEFVKKQGFENKVIFVGKMDKNQIAITHRQSDAFLFSSLYETFSVVCAEALCCGNPLIGPDIEAISEYADNSMYLKVRENDALNWKNAIQYFIMHQYKYNKEEISKKVKDRLSIEHIRNTYKEAINEYSK